MSVLEGSFRAHIQLSLLTLQLRDLLVLGFEFLHEFFGFLGHVVTLEFVSKFVELDAQEINLRSLNTG